MGVRDGHFLRNLFRSVAPVIEERSRQSDPFHDPEARTVKSSLFMQVNLTDELPALITKSFMMMVFRRVPKLEKSLPPPFTEGNSRNRRKRFRGKTVIACSCCVVHAAMLATDPANFPVSSTISIMLICSSQAPLSASALMTSSNTWYTGVPTGLLPMALRKWDRQR